MGTHSTMPLLIHCYTTNFATGVWTSKGGRSTHSPRELHPYLLRIYSNQAGLIRVVAPMLVCCRGGACAALVFLSRLVRIRAMEGPGLRRPVVVSRPGWVAYSML